MASGFSVKVTIDESRLEESAYQAPQVKSATTRYANQIAGNANNLAVDKSGVWHESGKPHTPGREGGTWYGSKKDRGTIGGVSPMYKAKPAKPSGDHGEPVAIVVTANYAAQKDNMKNNTLLKAMG